MQEIESLLNLKEYKIIKIEDKKENKKNIKIIYLNSRLKKRLCPTCNEYTSSIHDTLKPIHLKYLKVMEQDTEICIIKKRFICHKCNKKFTEKADLNETGKSISTKLEQKVLKDMLNYNLSLKYIAETNSIATGA